MIVATLAFYWLIEPKIPAKTLFLTETNTGYTFTRYEEKAKRFDDYKDASQVRFAEVDPGMPVQINIHYAEETNGQNSN